jgi:hypothetical protein
MEVNVLHPSEFVEQVEAMTSPPTGGKDHAILQAMADAALLIVNANQTGNPKPVVIDWRGIDAENVVEPVLFRTDNNIWAPIHIDMRGGMIMGRVTGSNPLTGKSNVQPLLKFLNTRSGPAPGNFRDIVLEGGSTRWGSVGLWMDGMQYCEVIGFQSIQSVMCGMFLRINGNSNSNIMRRLKVLEPYALSMLIEGDWTFDGLRVGENAGPIGVRNGRMTVNGFNGIGFNCVNTVKQVPHWGWQQNTTAPGASPWVEPWYGKDYPHGPSKPRLWNPPPMGIDPIFHLAGGGSLMIEGKLETAYNAVPNPPTAAYHPPNTIVHAANSGLIELDLACKINPDIKQVIAEGHLPGPNTATGKQQWPLNVRIRDASLHGDIALYRRLLTVDPSAVGYSTVRERRNFSGHVRMGNGGQILQDTHAPVDLSNLDIVNA